MGYLGEKFNYVYKGTILGELSSRIIQYEIETGTATTTMGNIDANDYKPSGSITVCYVSRHIDRSKL